MRRRAFTLIEIMVACALGTAIFAGAIAVYNLSNRSRGVTASARALETATLLEEMITTDLHRLVKVGAGPLRFYPDRPSKLAFFAYDPDGAAGGASVPFRAVAYTLADGASEKTPQFLQREWNAKVESVGLSPLTSAAFVPFMSPTGPLVRVTLTVGRDATDPAGPPLVHTFLARYPSPSDTSGVDFEPRSDFRNKDDAPQGQRLPAP